MTKKKTKSTESQSEKAFQRSDKHMLGDLRLNPWTPSRIIAAQSMGMLYPNIGKDGWDQYNRTRMYPGQLKDTVIGLWLCSVDDEAVETADCAPGAAYRTARGWAEEQGILKQESTEFQRARDEFISIINEVSESASKPVTDSETEDDDPNE